MHECGAIGDLRCALQTRCGLNDAIGEVRNRIVAFYQKWGINATQACVEIGAHGAAVAYPADRRHATDVTCDTLVQHLWSGLCRV